MGNETKKVACGLYNLKPIPISEHGFADDSDYAWQERNTRKKYAGYLKIIRKRLWK